MRRSGARTEGGVSGDWPLWEVFVRTKGGLAHRHVGSVHAPDAELALRHARDTYTRRMEGVSLWVVPSAEIVACDPDEAGELFEPAEEQDLPPPDLLRHPRRGEAHLMASLPPIDVAPRTRNAAAAASSTRPAAEAQLDPRASIICCVSATMR